MTWREEIIGDARLILGDCRDVLPMLDMADALFADPPFAIPHRFGSVGTRGIRRLEFSWDGPGTEHMVIEAIGSALSHSRWSAFVFCGLRQASDIARAFALRGFIDKPAAWVKENPPPAAPGNWWPSAFQLAVYGYKPGAWFGDIRKDRSNVFLADSYRFGQPGKFDHPTQTPLSLTQKIIQAIACPRSLVLDPFMGSGTSGVACAQLGRRFVGIEIEERYFDIACRRIEEAQRQGRLFDERPARPVQLRLGEGVP